MNSAEFQLRGVDDPRLAIHATSSLPAWLWAVDGTRIIWANPVGARLFGARNAAALATQTFGPADPHRRQVAQLAGRLSAAGATRLERLRGFGAPLGALVTCGCTRLEFSDGSGGVLIAAAEPIGRSMPLVERLQRLVEGIETPIATFARDGLFIGASDAARALLGFRDLAEAGLEAARHDALKTGRAELPIGIGHMVLQRVGVGADVGLVALLVPGATREAAQQRPPAEATPSVETSAAPAAEPPAEVSHPDAPAGSAPSWNDAAPPDAAAEQSPDSPAEQADEATAAEATIDAAAEDVTAAPAEAVAAEAPAATDEPPALEAASSTEPEPPAHAELSPPWFEDTLQPRRHPLRFTWQVDAEGHFCIISDEFSRLIGPRTAAGFGRLWREIAELFGLDPDGRFAAAIATRSTFSGIVLQWPVDAPEQRLAVEMSGLPVQDRDGNFRGFRGFGVCRDIEGLNRLAQARRSDDTLPAQPPSAATAPIDAAAAPDTANDNADLTDQPQPADVPSSTDPETAVDTPKNVLPFRPANDPRSPALTPVENNAFNELARQLSARLESEAPGLIGDPAKADAPTAAAESDDVAPQDVADDTVASEDAASEDAASDEIAAEHVVAPDAEPPSPADTAPDQSPAPQPARSDLPPDTLLLDLMPVGVLIYRLDRLLYANRAFLDRTGFDSVAALEQAGGLDVLYVESGLESAENLAAGTPITIAPAQLSADQPPLQPASGRLFTITWQGQSALALIFSETAAEAAPAEAAPADDDAEPFTEAPAIDPSLPSPVGAANAEELGAILDTTAEGIVMFDAEGQLHVCNRSAEALFGYAGDDLVQCNLIDLFAPESQRVMRDYLDAIKAAGAASLLDHGREVLGRVREGGLIPLSTIIGRTRHDGPNFFAVFRDLSQVKKTESELIQARRQADRAAHAKADVLARLSHEIRAPLNAILGFAEVMVDERFGTLGNERYVEYMKDIRASGERVIAIVNDLLDLSRIETGKLELAFTPQNLNELVEQCVGVMQPQANRERIIIRTSLAHQLPNVVADAQALRQITLNLIGTSIHLANAGGQVIVSTALSDFGDVVLRVRDTGSRLNEHELAAAMQPFRTAAPSDRSTEAPGVSLSLTKALVEANRAQFHIKTAPHSGTLIEVIFSEAMEKA
ncbi:PAS domain S-box-containing protein [Rhodopseudomonas rhenobacensis]|uniref:histidine kinase n=1 Tax=Rhodopseudomonas rhenobacensis TaxID=87461 RepID=A0A7W7Z3M0_9BRAD|nr:HAMP domain-containing sensor histidine kinase [Rhodopseudomonas rhenobacensis]MBB5047425.1 PAS domain S-box-containing protein [Rhodopseudomonas rhenobacensis]